jgi:hypothetical protein
MRDFCVAVAAVVPLLLLVMTSKAGLLPQHVAILIGSAIGRRVRRQRQKGGTYPMVIWALLLMGLGQIVARATVVLSLITELGVLAAVPFMPEGKPSGWQWVVFVWPSVVVGLLLLVAGYGLLEKASHNLEAPSEGTQPS